MACFRPLDAYRDLSGLVYFGKRGVGTDVCFKLPCGQCIGCRIDRSREWSLRCAHEALLHERNCFITLTYNDKNLPEDGSLDVNVWSKFAKRLRKRTGSLRYLMAAEYGPVSLRPHYHALIFGHDFRDDSVILQGKNQLWISPVLSEKWCFGFHTVGELNYTTANYVARYCLKKQTGPWIAGGRLLHDRESDVFYQVKGEFATMSRNPGIGSKWFDKFKSDVYPADECVVEGRHFRPPRYYDEKLDEAELELYKAKRLSKVDAWNSSAKRLSVRENVAESKTNMYARSL